MTEEELRDIKTRYPSITKNELLRLPVEEFNKCSINLLERLVKDYKEQLQSFFKNHKDWAISNEDIEWCRNLMREEKNSCEAMLKERVLAQKYLREGLNPPFFYKH